MHSVNDANNASYTTSLTLFSCVLCRVQRLHVRPDGDNRNAVKEWETTPSLGSAIPRSLKSNNFPFRFKFSWSSKSTAPAMGTRSIFEDPNCKENSNFMSDNVKVLAILQYGFEIILGFSLAYQLSVGLCFWSKHTEKKSISYFALSGLFRRWKQMCSAHFHGRQVHSAVVHTWDQVANLGPYCKHTRLKCLKWALLQTAKFNRNWVLGSEYPSIPGAHQNWCGNTITTFDDRISSLKMML